MGSEASENIVNLSPEAFLQEVFSFFPILDPPLDVVVYYPHAVLDVVVISKTRLTAFKQNLKNIHTHVPAQRAPVPRLSGCFCWSFQLV